jgi:DNA-binding transcriptional LysR family regulator
MNLRNIDLNLLVTLDALLSERHVTRAALNLSLTQSAVSTQLGKLREVFADPLFIPGARGVVPTQRALDLIKPLKQVLLDLEGLVKTGAPFDPASSEMTFHIASTAARHLSLCVPLTKIIRKVAPKVRLALHTLNSRQAAGKLEHGDLDLVLSPSAGLDPAWKSKVVMREHFVSVLRKKHPAIKKTMSLDLFCSLEHLLVSPQSGGFRGLVDDALATVGRSRRVAMSVQNFLVVPFILEATDLISTIPSHLSLGFPNSLSVVKTPVELGDFEISAAWHPRSHMDPGHQWVRKLIEQIGAAT